MGPEFEKGDGRLRPSLQQRLPGAEGPPEGCTTDPRHAACGGPLPSSAEGPCVITRIILNETELEDTQKNKNTTQQRAEQFCTTQLPEVAKARAEALEDATVTTATAEAAYTSRCITHGLDSTEAKTALADLEAAEAAEERARAPVNFPKNYAFSKNGTHLYAHTVAGWHGTKPENATISGDKESFYNTIAQALTADNKPDPNGCGRVKLLDWIRKRRPDLLPATFFD